jgi:hypothetical protein
LDYDIHLAFGFKKYLDLDDPNLSFVFTFRIIVGKEFPD